MGYTHYYTQNRDLTADEWRILTAVFHHMLKHLPAHTTSAGGYYQAQPLIIRGGYGDGQPEVNGRYLCFNGDDATGMAHEAFYLARQGHGFHFCKTGRKPYDLLVCALLLAVAEIAPGAFDITSDGDMTGDDWQPARAFIISLPDPALSPDWEINPC